MLMCTSKWQVELTETGEFDYDAIELALSPETRLIHIQRSCGSIPNPHTLTSPPHIHTLFHSLSLSHTHTHTHTLQVPVAGIDPDREAREGATLNPTPETRNPKPETRNPKPETRKPKPETLDPKPRTLNPKP